MEQVRIFIWIVFICLLFVGTGLAEKSGNISDVEISFMGIKFGTPWKEADAIFKKNGLKFLDKAETTYFYEGSVGGDSATVSFSTIDNNVEKFWINLEKRPDPKWEFMKRTEILFKKYGKPYDEVRTYRSPYNDRDDGSIFETGLYSGKIQIFDVYRDKLESDIFISLSESGCVSMLYVSKKSKEDGEKKRAKANEVF